MAAPVVTPNEVQAALSTAGHGARIIKAFQINAPGQAMYYVVAGAEFPGRARWCSTANSDDAADQAVAINNELRGA